MKMVTKLGIMILLMGIMLTGYGGLCKKDKDDDKDTIITGSSAPLIQIKQGTTDTNGETYFTDNSTGASVIVKPQDSDTQLPLAGIAVTFYDGDGSEVFMLSDSSGNYLPSMGVYTSNSEHIIKMGTTNKGTYYVARIDDEARGLALWSFEHESHMGYKDVTYVKTINDNELQGIYERTETIIKVVLKGIEYIAGLKLPFDPVELITTIAPEEPNPPQRWDMYTTQESGGTSYTHHIPSNVPEVLITSLLVNGANISVSWQGTDRTTYSDCPAYVPDREDLTVALGPTSNPDLTYSYRITNTLTGSVYLDWTPYVLGQTSASVSSIPNGNYRFEVKVQDEVENVSNIASWLFSINGLIFNYTGSEQQWVVPAGVTSIQVDVRGASGNNGYGSSSPGGKGARVQTTLTVTPGETLYIYVGGVSTPSTKSGGGGGYNGGGAGGYAGGGGGGGGGGASDIRTTSGDLGTRIVVAGGGGGGGGYGDIVHGGAGGYGGWGGGNSSYNGSAGGHFYGGGGGTQIAGGAGGCNGRGDGGSGGFGLGGSGGLGCGSDSGGGGGGGGGYYGGGGGCGGGYFVLGNYHYGGDGGGGGSSMGPEAGTTDGFQTGNGQIIITY